MTTSEGSNNRIPGKTHWPKTQGNISIRGPKVEKLSLPPIRKCLLGQGLINQGSTVVTCYTTVVGSDSLARGYKP